MSAPASAPGPAWEAALQGAIDTALAGDGGLVGGRDRDDLEQALDQAVRGGKRFRPRLAAYVHDALGGGAGDAVVHLGAALELLHTSFLVHDDVIDGDDLRRGRPSTLGRFRELARSSGADRSGADTYARAAAILVGDLALSHALRTVALCDVDVSTRRVLMGFFDAAVRVSADGQLADVRLSLALDEATVPEVIEMEARKTAVYSFELPMQVGAVLAGAPAVTVAALSRLGDLLGTAYQLLDDLDSIFGDPELTGKGLAGDLREGKRTPLLVHARSTPAWDQVAPLVGCDDLGAADVAAVRRVLEENGSRTFVEGLARERLHEASGLAARLGLSAEVLCRVASMSYDVSEVA